jgi:5,10-methylenetetrahydromethanopterin reductase
MAIPVGVLLNSEYSARELVRLGRLCEELGYDQLWYTDIRLFRECYLGLGAVAAETSRILLGPGVTDPYSRHPAVTAATMATLDELSEGRAILGLGVGGTSFRELGISTTLPVAALRESVDVIRRLLRGEEVTVEGKVVALKGGRLQFTPMRDRIPIYFATHGAQVARLGGEIADGVLLGNILSPSGVDFYVEQVHAGAEKAGRPVDSVEVSLRPELCVADNEEAAFAVMRQRTAMRLVWTYPHWEYLNHIGVTVPPEFAEVAARKDPDVATSAAALIPDDVVAATVAAGHPERVAKQLAAAIRPGITRITIRAHEVSGTGIGPVLRVFMEDVLPRIEKEIDQPARVNGGPTSS